MTVDVCEVFESIQGESTFAGLSCFFVRLAGCNLRCSYCDTTRAYGVGEPMDVQALVAQARGSRAAIVEITGGEPLLQEGFAALATGLRDGAGKPVLVETNGSCDVGRVPEGVTTIMDLKCPSSGESAAMDLDNLVRLRGHDEVKFVIGTPEDYDWAREVVDRYNLVPAVAAVLFSPVHALLEPARLAAWVMADGLQVRVQVQLHKMLKLQ